ncbi:MAG: NADH-quinone oxidoreductase subunit L [Phycisphaerae bacterium]|nr:NADH-quinone oxidoreductase subunit L [Phycisphaerae bacterium]
MTATLASLCSVLLGAQETHAAPAGAGPVVAHDIPAAITAPELSWAGWIIWLPLLSSIACALCAAFRVKNKLPAFVTVLSFAAAFGVTFWLHRIVDPAQPVVVPLLHWMDFAWGDGNWHAFGAHFSLYVDELTLFWMLFVTGLGTLIALYASEYMESDVGKGYSRFFFGVSIFIVAMAALVMSDNLVMLYLGWEGVGLASYLLIGYYYTRPSAVAAAKKAFIMNRVGDLGLAIGIFLIWTNYGTVEYDGLFRAIEAAGNPAGGWDASLIPFCLMLGAFGKSAQIPLYVWLPDAMEGPTPVSALIHAATMVTAGVYLIARMFPLFLLHPDALAAVAWIGGLTALLAATIGMAQYDIKRIFAYSTVSQLGYMFLGLGVGTAYGACYHTFTHAFFKALLFLTAGAVMHGFAGQLDLRRLSGLRRVPGFALVSWTMLVGCLWLSAFPFSAGFFSKDTILAAAMFDPHHAQPALAWMGLATAGLTAYYTFRVWFRVCAGPVAFVPGDELHGADGHGRGAPSASASHGNDHGSFHPHAPRLAINGVLLVLAIGAVLAGLPTYLVLSGQTKENWVESMMAHSSAALGAQPADSHEHPHLIGMDGHTAMFVLSSVVGLAGIAIAWVLHLGNRRLADRLRGAMLARRWLRWLPTAMEHKWYVDELYHACFRLPMWVGGHLLHFFDKHFIDGLLVNGIGRVPSFLGRLFQPLYNGALQGYAATMAGAVALILAWVVWKWIVGGGA